MLDVTEAPDLDLLLAPGDQAEFVALCAWTTRTGRAEASWLYIVLHQGHGPWTHAYRVVPDRRPGHLTVFLERTEPGDRREDVRAWLRARVAAMDGRRGASATG
jgi:hypothetical protein